MTRRERLSQRLAVLIESLLEKKASWSGDFYSGISLEGRSVHWFLTAQRIGKRLNLIETVTGSDQDSRVVRAWTVISAGKDQWSLEAAEKNHEELPEEWINDELEETIGRLEDPETARSTLEVPKARLIDSIVPSPIHGTWPRRLRLGYGIGVFILAFFILVTVSTYQFHRMAGLVREIHSTIDVSSTRQIQTDQTISARLKAMDNEIEKLRNDIQRERMAFEFTRKNTAMSLREQAEGFSRDDYSRFRAWNHLADRVEYAGSYGDIFQEISRLPENNAQAETVMALDRARIVPLSAYRSTVHQLLFPVRLDGKGADGDDFMISSGFGELRPSSLGTGGYLPHMAVDIINIRNILTVTPGNSIIRFPGEPGNVVASANGEVVEKEYSSIYGWFIEVNHPINPIWQKNFSGLKYLTTFYAHLADKPVWNVGDAVRQSDKLGSIGNTGKTTGPHLHFEVRVYRDNAEFHGKLGKFDRINPFVPIGNQGLEP